MLCYELLHIPLQLPPHPPPLPPRRRPNFYRIELFITFEFLKICFV